MNDYKTLCVISEWIDSELSDALHSSDKTHTVNRHVIAFLKRKQRQIDKTINHYEKVFDKISQKDLEHFFTTKTN